MKQFLLFFTLSAFVSPLFSQQWNPNAGLQNPYKAIVTTSSGTNPQYITDGNPHTYWESSNPLPFHYLERAGSNYFLYEKTFTLHPSKPSYKQAFDGNTNTKADISGGNISLILHKPENLKLITIKAFVKDSLHILVTNFQNKTEKLFYTPMENFQLKNFKLVLHGKVKSIRLWSNKGFNLFELGGLYGLPTEFVIFDFGRPRKIGWISSRHLNGKSVTKIQVLVSQDRIKWQQALTLNPLAIPLLQIPLKKTLYDRYLKIQFTLPVKNYVKAKLWEFAVYGPFGPYGKPPEAKPSALSYADAFGINTIWGFGYGVYSDRLKAGTGPALFRKVCTQLRTYHPLDWDMNTPQNPPDFGKMAAGQGTPAKAWLNWDREYGDWLKYGYQIDVTLTFKEGNFPDSLWHHPFQEAFVYGKKFASHFYTKTGLVKTIEIGNEPWDYRPEVYRQILLGMGKGIKSVSQATVLPCAVQAYDPQNDNRNYIADYIGSKEAPYIDGLNTHLYPYIFKENGIRVAVNPEDRRSEIWSIANLIRFRDANMPGKSIYVTEFGYDSKGGNESCTHPECVSEFEQAIYGVRMAMILWRLGARKFYWYFFANVSHSSFLYNRSGLRGSYKTGFAPKLSFTVFQNLLQEIGPYHFEKVLKENTVVYAYLLKNPLTGKEIVIAWRPTAHNNKVKHWVDIPVPEPVMAIRSVLSADPVSFKQEKKLIKVNLSGIPVLIKLKM